MAVPIQETLPHTEEFSTALDAEALLLEDSLLTIPDEEESPVDLGRDIAWNWSTGDFLLSPSLGLQETNETNALQQWIIVALQTAKNSTILYPKAFGSDLPRLIGSGISLDAISPEITRAISDALKYHDRIVGINNITFATSGRGETVEVSFIVVLDDDAQLQFKLEAGS